MTSKNPDHQRVSGWKLGQSWRELPQEFWADATPTPPPAPALVIFNAPVAQDLGIVLAQPKATSSTQDLVDTAAQIFSGQILPPGSRPLAQAYAGHQFGHFTMLGDGRAILLGEQMSPSGRVFDIQLKGAGQTRWSRRGDGRATLGPMLREFIISEAMAGLGIPTTRSLAVCTTGDTVWRERAEPGAVLTRVASSHVRVGTFEYAARLAPPGSVPHLAEWVRKRHFSHLGQGDGVGLLREVAQRQARLIAQWMSVGFIHGVMNTDNMALSGETIDYGPCAFMDHFDPSQVFSSIDHGGRYAWNQQPRIAQWNLARLAECLLPLMDADPQRAVGKAREVLEDFPEQWQSAWLELMRAKLGLVNPENSDASLISALEPCLLGADWTGSFRALTDRQSLLTESPEALAWLERWQERRQRERDPAAGQALMEISNPIWTARNHRVQEALDAAEQDNLAPLHQLVEVLRAPYTPSAAADLAGLHRPPLPHEVVQATFCGT